jgi:hypothetical protein
LQPLLSTVEAIYGLIRQAEEFNLQSQRKIAVPVLSGDPNVIHKLGAIQLQLPSEWQTLAHGETRVRYLLPFHDRQPRLSASETVLIIDMLTQTFAFCRDRQELLWLSAELRGMVQHARNRHVSRNGRQH